MTRNELRYKPLSETFQITKRGINVDNMKMCSLFSCTCQKNIHLDVKISVEEH